MQKYARSVIKENGTPVAGATITVYKTGTLDKASLFSDENGSIQLPNPTAADGAGRYEFYVANGDYDLKHEGDGLVTFTLHDITIYDPYINEARVKADATDPASGYLEEKIDDTLALDIDLHKIRVQKIDGGTW